MNRQEFKTVDENGNDISLAILSPSAKVQNEASLIYSSAWAQASRPLRDRDGKLLRSAAPLRVEIETNILSEHTDIWNDELQAKMKSLQLALLHGERKLAGGATELNTLAEGVEVANQMKKDRNELNRLLLRKSSLDDNSAESYAEMSRLNYLIYSCTVYNDSNKPFYSSLDNYYSRTNEKATVDAAGALMRLLNGANMDLLNKTPENEFLLDYGFLDDKYRRVNSDGHLVDDEGRLMDKDGNWVDEYGNKVDIEGNKINDKGEYQVPFKAFRDEFGNEIMPKSKL